MSDKSDTLATLQNARVETLDAIKGIPEDQMTVAAFGEWSIKDVLCHLASWEQFALPDIQRVARGHIPQLATFRREDVDGWNVHLMRSRNLFSLSQVMFEIEDSRRQLIEALEALPDGLFASGQLARTLVEGVTGGELGHAADIRRWRKEKGV
jgi:hypothetical protein